MKKFMCKAILNKESSSNTGLDWAISRRCNLEVGDDYFNAAGTKISFPEIIEATIRVVPSAFFFPGCILSIKTESGTSHHFGLSYTKFWKRSFPFKIETEKATVPYLWVRRIIIVGAIGYLLWSFLSPET